MDAEQTLTLVRPGAVLDGLFELERVVGSGGMGVVFRARDLGTGQPVAVKLLQRFTSAAVARFEREASTLARLRHPAIVGYVDHGVLPEGAPFLVMQWLEGPTLDQVIARGPLAIDDALVVARRVAEGLGAAHEAGLVHRDVKPANVVLVGGRFDGAVLVDFGLARDLGGRADVTTSGMLLGTPAYMAPELARGAVATPASDVYALGCVLFEMLTGRRTFTGETPFAVLARMLLDDAPRARSLRPSIPSSLDELVARLLARSVEQRPRDGNELAASIARWEAPPEPALTPGVTRGRRWLPAPSALVWGALADSDRWDRITGAPRTRYAPADATTEEGYRRARIASAELFGTPMRWLEIGEWVEGAWAWGERRFDGGPFGRIGLRFRVEPSGEGCEVEHESYVELREGTAEGARELVLDILRRRMERYLDSLEALFRRARLGPDALELAPTAVVSALLLANDPDDVLSGKAARWDQAEGALAALAEAPVDEVVRARLADRLRAASDEELRFVRPYELARALGLDRREVLRALAHVARRGALEPVFRLSCPACRTAAASAGSLGAIASHARCGVCQVDFAIDLARNVELGLRRPGLDLDAWAYCESSPALRPHVIASLGVARGRTRVEAVPLPPGEVRVRRVGGPGATLTLPDDAPGALEVRVDDQAVRVRAPERGAVRAERGFALISIENASGSPIEITIERGVELADAVRGVEAVTLAELLDVLGGDAPAVPLEVSDVAVLAIELLGVDTLCQTVGVSRAADLTRDALDAFEAAVRRAGGRVSAEAGTLALACFPSPSDAREAARASVAALSALHGALALRAGIASGPMIARRSPGMPVALFGGPLALAHHALVRAGANEITGD